MVAHILGRGPGGTLRLGIVGLGHMGRLHLRTWQACADVTIAALVDADDARRPAGMHGSPFFRDCTALLGRIDAAVIATPAAAHAGCALPLLAAGIHCLIEKPLAITPAEGAQLVAAAARHAAILAVGHSERFNPGVRRARLAIAGDVRRTEVFRMASAGGTRPRDADVVQDLMVHDLDWIIDGLGESPHAVRVRDARWHRGTLSLVSCALSFSRGRQVGLTASRQAGARSRKVVLNPASGSQDVIDLDSSGTAAEDDPLTLQAAAFLAAIAGRSSGIATGTDALAVMALGDRIRADCVTAHAPAA